MQKALIQRDSVVTGAARESALLSTAAVLGQAAEGMCLQHPQQGGPHCSAQQK